MDDPRPRNPIARHSDPETSHEAAEAITASGQRDRQAKLALSAVVHNPGLTSAELAAVSGLDRYILARRLPELEKLGRVVRGPKRVCSVSGLNAITWWLVWPGEGPW